jgi:O-acetyl-ADP-ribose deacetylase (regulator of RNase III)
MSQTKITTSLGNLVNQTDCDAIINSAHPSMLAGSGVCGVIHKAAGKELEIYGKQFAPLETNQAVITPGFNLDIKFIIHVSAPRHHAVTNPYEALSEALRNVFVLAERNGLQKIALPAIGTGVYGFPIEKAVDVYISTSREFLNSIVLDEIRFVFISPDATALMKARMYL